MQSRLATPRLPHKTYLPSLVQLQTEISEDVLVPRLVLELNVLKLEMPHYFTFQHFGAFFDLQLILIVIVEYLKDVGSSVVALCNVRHKMHVVASRHSCKHQCINGSEHILKVQVILSFEDGSQIENERKDQEHHELR